MSDYDNKLLLELFGVIEMHMNNNPKLTRIQLLVIDRIWKEVKLLPNVFTKGGHTYVTYKDKVLLLKRIKIKEPEGFKTVKVKKVIDDTKLLESKIWNKMLTEGSIEPIGEPVKIEWNKIEWKKDEQK